MILEDFRKEMLVYRESVNEEAASLKEPYLVIERMRTLYEKFDAAERAMADQVLREWLLSEDGDIRFDAMALVGKLGVTTAVPDLERLATRLKSCIAPLAVYELKKVGRVISELNEKMKSDVDGF